MAGSKVGTQPYIVVNGSLRVYHGDGKYGDVYRFSGTREAEVDGRKGYAMYMGSIIGFGISDKVFDQLPDMTQVKLGLPVYQFIG